MLALFVLGQSYSFLHHATTEHRECAQEASLVHGHCHHDECDPSATDPTNPIGEAAAVLDEEDLDAIDPDRKDHDHGAELCSVPTCHEFEKWTPVQPVLASRLASAAVVQSKPDSQAECSGIPVFRLAPKNSPPEAA